MTAALHQYAGSLPLADETIVLYHHERRYTGIAMLTVAVLHDQSGTLNCYWSPDKGVTWLLFRTEPMTGSALTDLVEVVVEPYADFKVEWVNGPSGQTAFACSLSLSDDRDSVAATLGTTGDASLAEQEVQTAALETIADASTAQYASGALGALNATVELNHGGMPSVFAAVGLDGAGDLVGEVTMEVSWDLGVNWFPVSIVDLGTKGLLDEWASFPAYGFVATSAPMARLRVSAYTSGSSDGFIVATPAQGIIDGSYATGMILKDQPFAATLPPVLVGGVASAAAPAAVSADGDAQMTWLLPNGQQAVNLRDSAGDEAGTSTNPLKANAPVLTASGTLGALNETLDLDHGGYPIVQARVLAGLTATVTLQSSYDGGTTWENELVIDEATSALATGLTLTGSAGRARSLKGAVQHRLKVTAYTSGSATAYLQAFPALSFNDARHVSGFLAHDGALAVFNPPVLMGGFAYATAPSSVDADGDAVMTWHDRRGAAVIVGDIAHDTADSGTPIKVGAKAAVSALPTAVANADRSNNISDRFGRQLAGLVDPGMAAFKGASYTTAQTGVALWTPAAGKRLCILRLSLATGGTTAGRVTVWMGASGDTTYTEGTDQVLFDGDFIPSATLTQQHTICVPFGECMITTDHVLRVTTSANITVRISVHGYEFTP